jgi:hypothetical protein
MCIAVQTNVALAYVKTGLFEQLALQSLQRGLSVFNVAPRDIIPSLWIFDI